MAAALLASLPSGLLGGHAALTPPPPPRLTPSPTPPLSTLSQPPLSPPVARRMSPLATLLPPLPPPHARRFSIPLLSSRISPAARASRLRGGSTSPPLSPPSSQPGTEEQGSALSESCLHAAAAEGDCDSLRELLLEGAAVDGRGGGGSTALHVAAFKGDLEACIVLLTAGGATSSQERSERSYLLTSHSSNRTAR